MQIQPRLQEALIAAHLSMGALVGVKKLSMDTMEIVAYPNWWHKSDGYNNGEMGKGVSESISKATRKIGLFFFLKIIFIVHPHLSQEKKYILWLRCFSHSERLDWLFHNNMLPFSSLKSHNRCHSFKKKKKLSC